jgi:formate/nitrite transporter FocA (FNT family)
MTETEENLPPRETTAERILRFIKSEKRKRLELLIGGFISGIIMGIVISALEVADALGNPMPVSVITPFMVGVVFSIVVLVWGIHKAITEQ